MSTTRNRDHLYDYVIFNTYEKFSEYRGLILEHGWIWMGVKGFALEVADFRVQCSVLKLKF